MTPDKLIITSILLGLFTLMGGLYGVLYCLASIQNRSKSSALRLAGIACYGVQCLAAVAVLLLTPLLLLWKLLVASSCVAYYFIPPKTLRYLIRLHDSMGS